MSNHKSYSFQVEVPTKKPDLKELLKEAGLKGLQHACAYLSEQLSSNNDSSRQLGLTIDVPQVQLGSQKKPDPTIENDED